MEDHFGSFGNPTYPFYANRWLNLFLAISDFLSTNQKAKNVERGNDESGVRFSTIHASKGLEWEHVFIIGMVEFHFPMNMAIADNGDDEEERRLFYVACNKVKTSLSFSTFQTNM